MNFSDEIKKLVTESFNAQITSVKKVGKGASGQVYSVTLDSAPYKSAIKLSNHAEIIYEEKDMLDYLRPRVPYKVPETYFTACCDGITVLAMEYIEGVNGNSKKLFFLPRKKHLADNIINTLLEAQKCSSDVFGPYKNPSYNTWEEYYYSFFCDIYDFTEKKHKNGDLPDTVMSAIELIKDNFNIIFSEKTKKSYLCHGDFWMCNMLIDFRKSKLVALLDPYKVIWAEPEYELFALTLGFGKTLGLYELYKTKCCTTKFCDLKVELYALCNELDWYRKLGSISKEYLVYRAERLIKETEKFQIKKSAET